MRHPLQVRHRVKVLHAHAVRDAQRDGGIVQDSLDAGRDARLCDFLRLRGRRSNHRHADAILADDVGQPVGAHNLQIADALPDFGRVVIEQSRDAKASIDKPAIVRQRSPQVADADERDGPFVVYF